MASPSLPLIAGNPQPVPRALPSHQNKQRENSLFRGILSFRPPAADKTSSTRCQSRAVISFLAVLLCWSVLWSALIGPVAAQPHDQRLSRPLALAPVEPVPAWIGSSLFLDTRPPPELPLLFMPPLHRDDASPTDRTTPRSRRAIATDPKSSSTSFAVPRPFDTGLSNNFTNSCATFLNRMLKDAAFNKCHPFSLMLQTSSAFFDASKSYLRITQTLDATCGVDQNQCAATLDEFARELVLETACKADYHNDNPVVLQAYNGLVGYKPAYQASCLRDNKGNYCYANAVSNSTSPTDSYAFYLPIGQELPGGSRPTCNTCLQDSMAIFANFARNSTQPLSRTYSPAAQQLSIGCGRAFISTPAAPLKAAAPSTTAPDAALTPTLALILIFFLQFFA